MKVLQIVENLDKGAAENWLIQAFLEANKYRPHWEWTFYCILNKPGKLDEIVIKNGGHIIKSPHTLSSKIKFLKYLRNEINQKKYDIIHAHHDYLNAFYILAFWNKSAFKISHIHNTDRHLPISSRVLSKISIPLLKLINNLFYNQLIGVSTDTINEFKYTISENNEQSILKLGIDLKKYYNIPDRDLVLNELKIPKSAKILIYIGRFTELKNPTFVVSVLDVLIKEFQEDYFAVFIGEGNERSNIEQKVEQFNLGSKVRILPWVNNPEKYLQIADVFVFPRKLKPKEGFGLVMLESQAAGLKSVVSTGVLAETVICNDLVHFMENVDNPNSWAIKIKELLQIPKTTNFLELLEKSDFNLTNSTRKLIELYSSKK